MQTLCLGLGYRTAPIELRERLIYTPVILDSAFSHLRSQPDSRPNVIHELAILSTCNRLEFYAASAHPPHLQHPDPFAPLVDFLVETRGLSAAEFETCLYRHAGPQAVEHLCRVASGLDSMILGEPQILGQVADAHETALRHRTVGPVLSALFRTAIRAGKRARTETAISRNPASISSMAVKLAEQVIYPLAGCRVVVVGAGEMGELAIEALRTRGVGQ
ncbi:MAG: glutamyl-tRNA reductase, partial [Chloroflexota bacterium]